MTLLEGEGNGGSGANGNNGGGAGGGGSAGAGAGAGAGSAGGQAGGSGGAGAGNGGSGGQTSWRDSLPEEIRGNATLGKYNDLPSLAKAHIELQGFVGKKGVMPPGANATPEQWKEFAKNIGQPEFEKFEIKTPEGKKLNAELVGGYKKLAHESGLLPHQAQGVLDWFIGQEEAASTAKMTAFKTELQTKHDALKKEWGDGFAKEIAKSKLAAKDIGGDEFVQYLEESGLGDDTTLVKFLNKAAGLLGEDKLRGEGGGNLGGSTPAEIQAEINKVMGDRSGPYFNKNHPSHKDVVRQMEARFKSLSQQRA